MQNEIALKFTNTVRWHASKEPQETLHGYGDLLDWVAQHADLDETTVAQLAELARRHTDQAAEVFARAIALREAMYRVFVAYLQGETANPRDIARFNDELAGSLAHACIVPIGMAYEAGWEHAGEHLDAVVWPIVRSAAEYFTTPELLGRVGQCADDRGCGWLFFDDSKNHSRRWCDINDCGNRAKQRRHYARTRSASARAGASDGEINRNSQ